MKINISVNREDQEKEEFQDTTPEHAWYPDIDEPLGQPATLEISFFNAMTEPDESDPTGYKDLVAAETDRLEPIMREIILDKGIFRIREQADYFEYIRNEYEHTPQFYLDEFGPENENRFKREPLRPIKPNKPDTIPPNIKERDANLRWDGVGVNTPLFHIDLIEDKKKPDILEEYKPKKVLERECNPDIAKKIPADLKEKYTIPRKFGSIKVKKKTPLTYVIDNIWLPKAHLSIEEIESASHSITNIPYQPDVTSAEIGCHYAIDSIEGIFWNKFDTYLLKDRTCKDDRTLKRRYKITTRPEYSAKAVEEPILKFTAGGILAVEAYMFPRNWWYWAKAHSPGVCEETYSEWQRKVYAQNFDFTIDDGVNPPTRVNGTIRAPSTSLDPHLSRLPVANYTTLFAQWNTPPHDFRLPVRDDDVIENDVFKPLDERNRFPFTALGGFIQVYDKDGIHYGIYAGAPYKSYIYTGSPPGAGKRTCGPIAFPLDGSSLLKHGRFHLLNDPGCNDEIFLDEDLLLSTGVRGNLSRAHHRNNYIKSGKYGFTVGGLRGLFLYNFAAGIVTRESTYYRFPEWYDYHTLGVGAIGEGTLPWVAYDYPEPQHGNGQLSFPIWHKTPDGCVYHLHTGNEILWKLYYFALTPRDNSGMDSGGDPKLLTDHVRWLPWGLALDRYASLSGLMADWAYPQGGLNRSVLLAMTLTPPDGGIWKASSITETLMCGRESPEHPNDHYDYDGRTYPNYYPQSRALYDAGSSYMDEEIDNFQKLWNKFYNSKMIQTNLEKFNQGNIPADNIPFIVGVAGAKKGTLVAILRVEGRIYYVWRDIDEEEKEEDEEALDIPLLPVCVGGSYPKSTTNWNLDYTCWPLFGCSEIWNEHGTSGNLKTAWDSVMGFKDYDPPDPPPDYDSHPIPAWYLFQSDQRTSGYLKCLPALGRLVTEVVHSYVSDWSEGYDSYEEQDPIYLEGSYSVGNELPASECQIDGVPDFDSALYYSFLMSGGDPPEPQRQEDGYNIFSDIVLPAISPGTFRYLPVEYPERVRYEVLTGPGTWEYFGTAPRNAKTPIFETEKLFDLEMPVYIMTYREQALHDSGPGASRWAGSFMMRSDKTVFTVSAYSRNRDSCGV